MRYYLEEYRLLLGTTLWTEIPKENFGTALHAVNDYNFIAKKDENGEPT
jgi:hypothetical protein